MRKVIETKPGSDEFDINEELGSVEKLTTGEGGEPLAVLLGRLIIETRRESHKKHFGRMHIVISEEDKEIIDAAAAQWLCADRARVMVFLKLLLSSHHVSGVKFEMMCNPGDEADSPMLTLIL